MVIFGAVIMGLSLIGIGWFVGVTVERHMYSKENTPSASHNTDMMSASQICPRCHGGGKELERTYYADPPSCLKCGGSGKLHHA